ncbi:hypothetical protein BHE74_00000763 [Ensete ventricosum]|nr:hypothetical protein GW17_00051122 [Ensete ventricosum]RWW90101.1 hypothetical protein BHE74_00000763 [Ensete ventricosum]RZR75906.1 hypothetical protein BHM03_00000488 [Ensete ventricosum]
MTPGSSLEEDDSPEDYQDSLGDSPKGSGSSLGIRREIVGRRPKDLPHECRRLPEWRDNLMLMKLCAPDVDEDDDGLLLEKPFDLLQVGVAK